jgi:hypothetical protein
MHTVHTLPPYFSKIHSNIILPSTLKYSEWSLSFWFSNQNFLCVSSLSHACYMPRPCHPTWFDHPNNIWWSLQVMKLLIMQPSPASRHFLLVTAMKTSHVYPSTPPPHKAATSLITHPAAYVSASMAGKPNLDPTGMKCLCDLHNHLVLLRAVIAQSV